MPKTDKLHLDRFVPYRLSVTSNAISDVIAGAYRTLFGLTVPEWRLITILAARGHETQFGLAAATLMDKVTVSRAATALVGRGLVARTPNPQDGRSRFLSLTEVGHQLYGEVAPKALALETELLSGFTAEEVRRLVDMLLRLEQAAVRLQPV